MKKIMVLLLLLFTFDVVADGIDFDCSKSAAGAGCHSCLCWNHGTGMASPPLVENSLTVSYFISNPENAHPDFLFLKGVFHPPQFPA